MLMTNVPLSTKVKNQLRLRKEKLPRAVPPRPHGGETQKQSVTGRETSFPAFVNYWGALLLEKMPGADCGLLFHSAANRAERQVAAPQAASGEKECEEWLP